MKRLLPPAVREGDAIGIISPAALAERKRYEAAFQTLRGMGFRVLEGEHLFSSSYGYAASLEERAEDFNRMALTEDVRMILFGGGEVSNELLPLLDYEAIRRNPKIVCSYSDGTTLLNAVAHKSGLVTFYGQSPRTFMALTEYNRECFASMFMEERRLPGSRPGENWRILREGTAAGRWMGGYLGNLALMAGGPYFPIPDEPILLFLEDHESFSSPAAVAKYTAHLEQSGLFRRVKGLLWGFYSEERYPAVEGILFRLGERYGIPVACCGDFGHGERNAVMPIGLPGELRAEKQGACEIRWEVEQSIERA